MCRWPAEVRTLAPVHPKEANDGKGCAMRLFVANLPFDASRSELFDLFGRYGRIMHLELPLNPVTRRPMGIAVVAFYDRKDARRAARELEGFLLRGRLIRLDKRRHRARDARGRPGPL